jgi:hypothetical protein
MYVVDNKEKLDEMALPRGTFKTSLLNDKSNCQETFFCVNTALVNINMIQYYFYLTDYLPIFGCSKIKMCFHVFGYPGSRHCC